MLNDYKRIYYDKACELPSDWKTLSKNDLCNRYIENEKNKELAERYFSAIIYRYWFLISKFYKSSYNVCTIEDCYDWLIESIMYALKHRRWLCPDSSIYKDINGPDKVINRCMKCRRYTYYQSINRQKRKDDFNLLSLDKIKDEHDDNILLQKEERFDTFVNDIVFSDYIVKTFKHKDYFLSFLLDFVINANVFVSELDDPTKFKKGRVVKYFKKIDDKYLQYFSAKYNLSFEKVKGAYDKYLKGLKSTQIYRKMYQSVISLKEDENFKKLVNN